MTERQQHIALTDRGFQMIPKIHTQRDITHIRKDVPLTEFTAQSITDAPGHIRRILASIRDEDFTLPSGSLSIGSNADRSR